MDDPQSLMVEINNGETEIAWNEVEYEFYDLDTERPLLRVGNTYYVGEVRRILGTCLSVPPEPHGAEGSSVLRPQRLEDVHSTSMVINFTPARIKSDS